jgi:Transposase DDE domain
MRPKNLGEVLRAELDNLRQHIREDIDAEALARHSGFLRRSPRKLPMTDLLLVLVGLAAESFLTLQRVASVIALATHLSYSKQALHKRLTPAIERFLAQAATALFGQLPEARSRLRGCLGAFRRVLLHDSTVETLPEPLAQVFPGSRNQRKGFAALKIQFIADWLSGQAVHLSLSSFRRNDQAAALDILEVVQPGDLVIRDLGYFVIRAFQWIIQTDAFLVSRCRADTTFSDSGTGQPLDLVAELRRCGRLDRHVLMGSQKVPVRLVALPVPEAVANERRRRAKAGPHPHCHPSAQRLFLLGWNVLITNVPRSIWSSKVGAAIYRLRWRIEMIFKAWKTHLGLRQFHCRSAKVLRLSVMTKLLFCVLVYRCCQSLELLCGQLDRRVSLQRLARVMSACACLVEATLLGTTPQRLLEHSLGCEIFYEQRKDRKNFSEIFAELARK